MTRTDLAVAVTAALGTITVTVLLYGLLRAAAWADRHAPAPTRQPPAAGVARLEAWLDASTPDQALTAIDQALAAQAEAASVERAGTTVIRHGDIRAALRTQLEQPCRPLDSHFCLNHDAHLCRRFAPCCGACPTDPT